MKREAQPLAEVCRIRRITNPAAPNPHNADAVRDHLRRRRILFWARIGVGVALVVCIYGLLRSFPDFLRASREAIDLPPVEPLPQNPSAADAMDRTTSIVAHFLSATVLPTGVYVLCGFYALRAVARTAFRWLDALTPSVRDYATADVVDLRAMEPHWAERLSELEMLRRRAIRLAALDADIDASSVAQQIWDFACRARQAMQLQAEAAHVDAQIGSTRDGADADVDLLEVLLTEAREALKEFAAAFDAETAEMRQHLTDAIAGDTQRRARTEAALRAAALVHTSDLDTLTAGVRKRAEEQASPGGSSESARRGPGRDR